MADLSSQHWLMVRFGHLGDVLLTTGILRYLGEKYGCSFDVLTREEWAPVFKGHPYVKTVHAATAKNLVQPELFSYLNGIATQYATHALGPSGLLDLHGNLRTRILRCLWKGPVASYHKMRLQRSLFQASKGRLYGAALRTTSVLQRYAQALETTVVPERFLLPEMWLTAEERAEGRELLQSALLAQTGVAEATTAGTVMDAVVGNALTAMKPVALHPFATHVTKAWPMEHWHSLTALLDAQRIPWVVVGRGDASLFSPSGSAAGKGASLVNGTSLRQSAAVLAACSVLVTGDSGPMHLARAVQTPVVALFGPTTQEWGFFPTESEGVVLEQPLACRPCSLHGKALCPRQGQCLREIAPQQVLAAIARISVTPSGTQGGSCN